MQVFILFLFPVFSKKIGGDIVFGFPSCVVLVPNVLFWIFCRYHVHTTRLFQLLLRHTFETLQDLLSRSEDVHLLV